MKKIILPLFFLLFCDLAYSGTIQMNTVLPPPINTYHKLLLTPQNDLPDNCQIGTIYTRLASGEPMVCDGTSPKSLKSVWVESGEFIYLRDIASNENLKVGIGTTSPMYTLQLTDQNISGSNNEINFIPVNGTQNAGIQLRVIDTPTIQTSNAAYIDFKTGLSGKTFDGRISYRSQYDDSGTSFGPSGLGFYTEQNIDPDIWIDSDNHNVGIGQILRQPVSKLEVNGNLKTTKLYLISDGANTGQLKAMYKSGKYYATWAP